MVHRPATRGRVLVVDDEPALGKAIQRMLSSDHDLVVVTSANQALAMIGAGERFDAVLSDLMMPEMTGMELYEKLMEAQPGQAKRMIFMSGGAFTPDAAAFISKESRPMIEKPFRAAILRQMVQKVLTDGSTHQ